MKKFRKKPVIIDAVQFTGSNHQEVSDFIGSNGKANTNSGTAVTITTLEGVMVASPGDWIIRGVKGEYYPCKPDIFAATYEEASE